MEEATALKNKGNDAFKNKEWPKAIDFYSQAIDKYDKEPSFYTNRAQVRISSQILLPVLSTDSFKQGSHSTRGIRICCCRRDQGHRAES